MRQTALLFLNTLFFIFAFNEHLASQIEYKYGKINMEELQMKTYPKDSSAQAVVLYEDGYTSYIYRDNFSIQTEVKCRIKILKSEGTKKATISIPLYRRNRTEETLSGIEAYSYNLEGGKITKTKLEKSNMFEEKVTDNLYLTKLAIPGAKEGSVIEYKYTLNSPFYYDISDWVFQRDIPVQQSKYEVMIPEYFIYKRETKGYEKIDIKQTEQNQSITVSNRGESATINHKSTDYVFTVHDLPALSEDNYIWEISDFLSAIRFELSATNFPGSFYKPYTSNWDEIEKTIKDDTDLLKDVSRSTPLKEELKKISSIADPKEKAEEVYRLIKSKIRWNDKYAFTGNPGEAFKTGTGTNAQINGALISALNEVGVKAYPVLLRRRSEGRLPLAIPSFDKISTFTVAMELDSTLHYLEGSSKYGGLDMIPSDFMVDRARTFRPNGTNDWLDLSKMGRNIASIVYQAELSASGEMKVKSTSYYKQQQAYHYKEEFASAKDSTEFIEKLETNSKVKD